MAHQLVRTAKHWAKSYAALVYTAVVFLVFAALYVAIFVIPKTVTFSYGAVNNCTTLPTLLPTLPRTVTRGDYIVIPEGGWKLGSSWLMATRLCVLPTEEPESGSTIIEVAPLGSWLFRQRLAVHMPGAPTASVKGLDAPIPSTKPLTITLSAPDRLREYTLHIGQEHAKCTTKSSESAVQCDIPNMNLQQGQSYSIDLRSQFGKGPQKSVLKTVVQTLTATTITGGSMQSGETVYARPTEFSFTADKALRKATVIIQKGDEKVDVTTTVEGNQVIASLAKELDRDKEYTLVIDGVEASDGSTLIEPYEVRFHTSGGPKVIAVSVGHAGVAQNATITVTFDQELSTAQDVVPIASATGASVRVTKSSNSIGYTLAGVGLCADFVLTLAKGLESKFGIVTDSGWSYSSRTICHTTSTYGYSLKGRPLLAYSFGSSGPTTMYVGAIHGNESSSSGILRTWIDDLESNPNLYNGKRVVIVPTSNPDGLAAGTRTNSRGVNLNRNFPTDGWVKDINDTDGYHEGGGGESPLSEPEARALAELTIRLRPRLLLSYHAVGSLVVGDSGGYSAGYASRYAAMVGYSDATGNSGTFDYDITGAYEDWTYAKQAIPSMVIELGSYGYYNFSHHRAAMRSMLQ